MKCRAYLDIETTGLSRYYADLTVIGIVVEKGKKIKLVQLIGDGICESKLFGILKGVDEIYTYNGSRFDVPFIEAKLAVRLKDWFVHTDLMYDCWRNDLKGGLKVVEKKLQIKRHRQDIDGRVAVQLWYDYANNNNKQALQSLLEYNQEDVINLRTLRIKLHVD